MDETRGRVTASVNWSELLEQLGQPFPASAVYWRAGSTTRDKRKAQALPYAEPRVYEDILNRVVPGDWSCRFVPWGERLICELTIHGVVRSSTGEENDGFAPGTATEAQAFKRACSKFGLGRYLYDIPISWVEYDDAKKKLLEVPDLPAKFLPKPPAPQKSARDTANKEAPRSKSTLSKTRASAMHKELAKEGVPSGEHHAFAADCLGRPVDHLTDLTEAEALEVWQIAKRHNVKRKEAA